VPSQSTQRKRQLSELTSINVTEAFLTEGWDYAGQSADACYAQANETGSLIGTAFAAKDMIAIIDALGEDGLLRYYGWYVRQWSWAVSETCADTVSCYIAGLMVQPSDPTLRQCSPNAWSASFWTVT
jgi:hypothetical protein